jgi:hypothetical protein
MPEVVREVLAMRQVVLLSARGLGTTSPNPPLAASCSDPAATSWGRASTSARAARTPRHGPGNGRAEGTTGGRGSSALS